MPPKLSPLRNLSLLLLLLLFLTLLQIPKTFALIDDADLTAAPLTLKTSTEFTFRFSSTTAFTLADTIRVSMPGFTTSTCEGIGNGRTITDQVISYRSPDAWWEFRWYEGSVNLMFSDSYFTVSILAVGVASATSPYTIIIDKANNIKSNIGTIANLVLTDDLSNTMVLGSGSTFTNTLALARVGYFIDTSVDVSEAVNKIEFQLTLGFRPLMDIVAGETITFTMSGFTTSDFSGVTGSPIASMTITPLTNADLIPSYFAAAWTDGTYVQNSNGYLTSNIVLTVASGITLTAGTLFSIPFARSTRVGVMCSIPENSPLLTIESNAALGPVAATPVIRSDAVGNGCKHLNNCSGRGECDYCKQTCTCADGHGSPTDISEGDVSVDCAQIVCPAGISWGDIPTVFNGAHPLRECSGSGRCNRNNGECNCFQGFSGRVCERRECPKTNDVTCSGHGRCFSIKQLSTRPDALPLSDYWDIGATGDRYALYGGSRTPVIIIGESNVTWDEHSNYACHCDSSWPVGLQSGEFQSAEYHGAACQFKRCPSGDDPMILVQHKALGIQDTDCSNKVAEGGRGMGKAGNMCIVECSNRGACEQETGTCECFKGSIGEACQIRNQNLIVEE